MAQDSEDDDLETSHCMVGQKVATVAAHQPGNSPNPHLQNLANDGTPNSEDTPGFGYMVHGFVLIKLTIQPK